MAGNVPPEAFRLDSRAVVQRFARAARGDPGADVLAREVERRMSERLDLITYRPSRILDAGAGIGPALPLLRSRYPEADVVALDLVPAMLAGLAAPAATTVMKRLRGLLGGHRATTHAVCADFAHLPFAAGQFGMVWSNLALNWTNALPAALAEWHRVLAVGGLAMFTAYGPDTLRELRATCQSAAPGSRVHAFVDMHDIGDMLVNAGFADPVMDVERLTLTYDSFDALTRDLRASGQTNALAGRPRGLLGRARWAAVAAGYEAQRRDGRLPATVEVIYGHAWKPQPRVTDDGRAIIRFAERPRSTRG